jgi:luciferase family oxidoreductase group 1
MEVIDYFRDAQAGQQVTAVPGAGLRVPIWILGSSLFGAQVAAALGLPFSFASHFAPQLLHQAIEIYRDHFTPSEHSQTPYVMLGVNIVAADTDAEARLLASSGRQAFASLRAGRPIQLPPPSKEWERDPSDRDDPTNQTRVSFVGAPSTIKPQIEEFIAATKADELIAVSHIYDHAARLHSYKLAAAL